MENSILSKCLSTFSPISLQQMGAVKLMNRTDTKFVCPVSQLPSVLKAIAADYFVQEIDHIRLASYHTTYYDTFLRDMYLHHHDRQLTRQKVRVREYVDTHDIFLEVKRKNNKGRTKKKRIAITPAEAQTPTTQMGDFVEQLTPYQWNELMPRVQTDFQRITLVNRQMTERVTIDVNLQFTDIASSMVRQMPAMAIIELKRDKRQSSNLLNALREQGVKPMKISKYCIGTVLTCPSVKQNRFKVKLHKINKLCQNTTPV